MSLTTNSEIKEKIITYLKVVVNIFILFSCTYSFYPILSVKTALHSPFTVLSPQPDVLIIINPHILAVMKKHISVMSLLKEEKKAFQTLN